MEGGSLLRRVEARGGVDGVLAIRGKLRRPAAAKHDEQPHTCAARVVDDRREPHFAVDFATQERQSRALMQLGQHAQAEREIVNRLGIELDQLKIVLTDPGVYTEVPHLLPLASARLCSWLGRQQEGNRVVSFNRL